MARAGSVLQPLTIGEGEYWPDAWATRFLDPLIRFSNAAQRATGNSLVERTPDGRIKVAYGTAGYLLLGSQPVYIVPKCFFGLDGARAWGLAVPEYLRVCRQPDPTDVWVTGPGTFQASPRLLSWWADYYSRHLIRALSTYPFLQYERAREPRTFLRGRIVWETQARYWAQGNHRFACEYRRYQADNALNRLLRWAAEQFAVVATAPATRTRLHHCLELLSDASAGTPERRSVDQLRVSAANAAYRTPLEIARSLYRARYPSLAWGRLPASGFLVNMQSSFEAFVDGLVYLVVRSANAGGANWGFESQRQALLANALIGTKNYFTRPDNAVIRNRLGASPRGVIVDAKYKGVSDDRSVGSKYKAPTSGDLYQVIASCIARRWAVALVLSPARSSTEANEERSWEISLHYPGQRRKITVIHRRIDLAPLSSRHGLAELVKKTRDRINSIPA